MTPETVTAAYLRYGLPATLPDEQRLAWEAHEAGKAAPLSLLPKNGATCHADSMGGPYCGYPLLIDNTCPNYAGHRDVVEAELVEPEEGDEEVT